MGVMEGESAIRAIYGPRLDAASEGGEPVDDQTRKAIEHTRSDYEHQLDARYAAARGFVDAIVAPEETRDVLEIALRCARNNPAPHVGPFTLPDSA
jgi:acetyl-CoA carboxylase carboxyltransferase component